MRLYALTATLLFTFTATAQASVIDFLSIANSDEYGAASLNYDSLTITASKDNANAFAYLDSGDAGLGVCGTLGIDNRYVERGNDQCIPASDDNVQQGEHLTFTFGSDTWVQGIYLNSNHDHVKYFEMTDQFTDVVKFNDTNTLLNEYGYQVDYNKLLVDPFFVAAGDSFTLGHSNKQFYVSMIEFVSVSEPGTIGLIAIGLFGLSAARRRQGSYHEK